MYNAAGEKINERMAIGRTADRVIVSSPAYREKTVRR
jgi:hypothetical protein